MDPMLFYIGADIVTELLGLWFGGQQDPPPGVSCSKCHHRTGDLPTNCCDTPLCVICFFGELSIEGDTLAFRCPYCRRASSHSLSEHERQAREILAAYLEIEPSQVHPLDSAGLCAGLARYVPGQLGDIIVQDLYFGSLKPRIDAVRLQKMDPAGFGPSCDAAHSAFVAQLPGRCEAAVARVLGSIVSDGEIETSRELPAPLWKWIGELDGRVRGELAEAYREFKASAPAVLKTGLEGFFNVRYLTLDKEWQASFRDAAVRPATKLFEAE